MDTATLAIVIPSGISGLLLVIEGIKFWVSRSDKTQEKIDALLQSQGRIEAQIAAQSVLMTEGLRQIARQETRIDNLLLSKSTTTDVTRPK
jgi:hypothetical protein